MPNNVVLWAIKRACGHRDLISRAEAMYLPEEILKI
jgi:hypothetical protein